MDSEKKLEQTHLNECLDIIRDNIRLYEEKERAYKKEITELTQEVRHGEGDSYGQLIAGQNILEHTQNSLRKNRAALKKAYFGKIEYRDLDNHSEEALYIGKNGITRNQTDVIIVDWRAPVSSVYYENETGTGSYAVPGGEDIPIDLAKKRTYDIAENQLLGYYDDDAAANDDLLVKYLSQNKEAVLGDIIATIQKEQNLIIRDTPYKNIIVQGVAGSGKTTVALHRISYLLYNYEAVFKPSEFCIVGSSDMLLNYISSGLPELDVNHVKQMRMDLFIPYLMHTAWKKKYRLVPDRPDAKIKSKLPFIKNLEHFLLEWRNRYVSLNAIRDPLLGTILSAENLQETFQSSRHLSLLQLEKLLNTRIASRIRFLCTELEPEHKANFLKEYKNYYHSDQNKWDVLKLYDLFLSELEQQNPELDFADTKEAVSRGALDIYDAAAIALIWKRILCKKDDSEFSQIIIDEAQDYGEMIYYVLGRLLPDCHFTIMGDVSQNIRYDTGMNDWEGLKEALFEKEADSFYLLSKSYRNTIEISECAGIVLEKAAQGAYKIQPVIRHGKDVCIHQTASGQLSAQLISAVDHLIGSGYETIAVICRNEKEAEQVRGILGMQESEEFHNGVMILPVTLTKGLEFDAVILWKPDTENYKNTPEDAKLLYVAITRALHELHMVLDGKISDLLKK